MPVTSATVVSSAFVSDSTTSSGTRERSRSPVRLSKDTGDEEQTVGLENVIDWVGDNLGDLCPSPGPDVPEGKTIKHEPFTQLPLHPVAWDIMESLNEEFKGLSLSASFKAAPHMKRRYPVHTAEFLDAGMKIDDDIKYLTGSSSSSSYKVQDAKLCSIETEVKRALKVVGVGINF